MCFQRPGMHISMWRNGTRTGVCAMLVVPCGPGALHTHAPVDPNAHLQQRDSYTWQPMRRLILVLGDTKHHKGAPLRQE